MSDFEKKFNDFAINVSTTVDETVKVVKEKADKEISKIRLRSEIGQNERDIAKAYAKLGEAYYNAKENNSEMSDVKDLLDLIRSKKKLIELLEEKLDAEL